MPTIKTNAVVLRHADYRDYDRMLTLFSPTLGRVDAISRGCRRPKSTMVMATEVFSCGEYLLYEKGERYSVTSFTRQDGFYPLRLDVDKLTHAVYLLNLCEAAVQPGEGNEALFLLLLRALAMLAYGELPDSAVTAAFCVRFAELTGFRPELTRCVVCGEEAKVEKARFLLDLGGIACGHCGGGEAAGMETLAFLRRAQSEGLAAAEGDLPDTREALHLMRLFLEARIERRVKSAKFLS